MYAHNIKKTAYLIAFITIAIFLMMSVAHAQTSTVPVGSAPGMNDASERRDAMQEKMAERRMTLNKNMQDRIINLGTNATNRLKAGSGRMTNIITRIESRIGKLKAQGIDTAPAEAKLTEAKSALASADTAIAQLGSIKNAITSDDFRTAFKPIRTQFMSIRDLLRETHLDLHETVQLLKEAKPQSSESSSENTSSTEVSEGTLEVQ